VHWLLRVQGLPPVPTPCVCVPAAQVVEVCLAHLVRGTPGSEMAHICCQVARRLHRIGYTSGVHSLRVTASVSLVWCSDAFTGLCSHMPQA
jgi:hypothetical protein